MTTHTPGPWWINKTNGSENEICSGPSGLDAESQSKIVTVAIAHGPQGEWGKVGAEHEANARLIAAAPELLERLITMADSFHYNGKHLGDLKTCGSHVCDDNVQLIAKAEGK